MIEIKLYLYDKDQEYFTDYRGEDLSKYVGQGVSDVEDITQEMDVTDITLFGSPRQKEYDPEQNLLLIFVKMAKWLELCIELFIKIWFLNQNLLTTLITIIT